MKRKKQTITQKKSAAALDDKVMTQCDDSFMFQTVKGSLSTLSVSTVREGGMRKGGKYEQG